MTKTIFTPWRWSIGYAGLFVTLLQIIIFWIDCVRNTGIRVNFFAIISLDSITCAIVPFMITIGLLPVLREPLPLRWMNKKYLVYPMIVLLCCLYLISLFFAFVFMNPLGLS